MKINKELEYLISEIPIFHDLDADDTQVLSHYLFPKELPMDGLVCKEGQHGSFLSFVASGELEIVKTLDNKEVIISKISKGDSLGEMALIDGLTRSATVRACQTSTILILRRDDFNTLLAKHPEVGIKILKGIARMLSLNLRKASAQITTYMTMTQ
ncbi:MAG: cyclic nucleotide-binding domain-containing protein [gamma proteobacterium symbiont of Bathyaustriella thionipta]|nr:cyclic nucleotide-binding domain-containing protein [gamma proteobacterium symbiont of Bathyaustriella thionipta]MCU7949066.1 cyclic nucleotide-binding domain-containing protein [gamma proteobacterium symbiont of Bathyaustriella thionipta]MCU7952787.1 cyclic nucleotide-binding domain-containing protein [gamma proteobacterium symbiont of Bathyaustriella thionipta]MCU7955717.1 cyclic nucleotide-binding domain-containing protein [gamma proteobacterium symbiont of Bathyaustriella thionipta]MCU79